MMEKNIALISLFTALIAVLGLIPQITLGFGVPITAQTLGVMLCGTMLGAKRGGIAVLLFLLLVAIGLPLLAGGRGGLGAFVAPTSGFLIGFPIAAFVTGLVMHYWCSNQSNFTKIGGIATIASIIGGVIVIYPFGIIGLAIALDKSLTEAATLVMIFIPGDILKAIIAGLLTAGVAKWRPNSF